MIRRLVLLLISVCTLCFAATADAKTEQSAKAKAPTAEQKARAKAQRQKVRREVRQYENLRNEAILDFARTHQPSAIFTPSFVDDFRISDVICAGDKTTGDVVLVFSITPLRYSFRLYMGGEQNGTIAYADGNSYPASDMYGRIYTLRNGQPEQITVTFYTIPEGVDVLDRVNVSMGLEFNILNLITMRNVPIYWTYSDKTIRYYVEEAEKNSTQHATQEPKNQK